MGNQYNPTSRYTKEISHPILTKEKEVGIAQRIERAIKENDKKAEADAKKELIRYNLKLVASVARDYQGLTRKYTNHNIPLLDLIQEGNIGLMKAVDKFDYRKGCKFSTYATYCIRTAILRYIPKQLLDFKIPDHLFQDMSKVGKAREIYLNNYGREPSLKELSKSTKRGLRQVEKAKEMLEISGKMKHLEASDIIEKKSFTPSTTTVYSLLREQIEKGLNTLAKKEREIVILRFGVRDGCPKTLEEVAKTYNITRERVRRIEAEALSKIRHPTRTKRLKNFLNNL